MPSNAEVDIMGTGSKVGTEKLDNPEQKPLIDKTDAAMFGGLALLAALVVVAVRRWVWWVR